MPDNFRLMYGRGDGSNEIILNYLVKQCDKKSTELIKEIELLRSKLPVNNNIGCIFRNPIVNNIRTSAGKLIDDIGLKGYSTGGFEISSDHCNIIINKDNGSYISFRFIIDLIKEKIKNTYDIDLIEEVECIKQ